MALIDKTLRKIVLALKIKRPGLIKLLSGTYLVKILATNIA